MSTPDIQALFAALAKPRASSVEPNGVSPITQMSNENGAGNDLTEISPNNPIRSQPSRASDPSSRSVMPSITNQPDLSRSNERVQSLLGLLNFGSSGSADQTSRPSHLKQSSSFPPEQPTAQRPGLSASDLVASFTANSVAGGTDSNNDSNNVQEKSQTESQEALLRLLSQSRSSSAGTAQAKPVQQNVSTIAALDPSLNQQETSSISNLVTNVATDNNNIAHEASPIRVFGTPASRETTPFEPPVSENHILQKENVPLFTYQNPFEALNASRSQKPSQQAPAERSNPPMHKAGVSDTIDTSTAVSTEKRNSSDESRGPNPLRRKLNPKLPDRTSLPPAPTEPEVDVSATSETVRPSIEVKLEPTPEDVGIDTVPDFEPTTTATIHGSEEQPLPQMSTQSLEQPHEEADQHEDGEAADVWESAEDSPAKDALEREVPVFNFPIKPFISVTLESQPASRVSVRDDGVMEISRLKREFDQADRTLAAATSKYIAYAFVKSGGMRIIRQDDGSDRQVFKNSHDRVFNVTFCTHVSTGPPTNHQAVLGTGISGSVYYATVSKESYDFFEENTLENESLIFPPFPPGDENTSGGILKTRAKRSSRHPEYFAIGRSKNIYIVWPKTAMSPKYGVQGKDRVVDVEKFYRDHSLRITTGKAGKDFTFSEDDTVIASLDKAGRLRFWDIRPLVDESNAKADVLVASDVDTPLLSLNTASAAERSWPTSVLFVDKIRPYLKGGALRYSLLGLKQNHTLQLWDIALGKAVQELNFPHEAETDAICSVSYHPSTGIIVVGHPTRNSIYFIHLSAPKYTLSHMSQAIYTRRLANKDPDLPRPESTAVMSGIREMSFASKGQLRSIELLSVYKTAEASKSTLETLPLFELYVVHSKGVTCLNITKDDLGWNSENKVLRPVDAVAAGIATLKEIRLGSFINEELDTKADDDEAQPSIKTTKKKSPSKRTEPNASETQVQSHSDAKKPQVSKIEIGSTPDGTKTTELAKEATSTSKDSKKFKKKPLSSPRPESAEEPRDDNGIANKQALDTQNFVDEGKLGASSQPIIPQPAINDGLAASKPESVTVGISGDWLDNELKKVEQGVTIAFRQELSSLYRDIQNDRNVQDSTAVARHEAVLRLVSSMLSTNVENSLTRIVTTQMQQAVVPSITSVVVPAVVAEIGGTIVKALHQLVPHELTTHLPVAIGTALQSPQLSRTMSEIVSQKLAAQIELQMSDLLHNSITPSFQRLAISAAEQAATDVEGRLGARIRQIETERRNDSAKMDQLNQILRGMAETIQAMSDSQVAFQGQILKDRRQMAQVSETGSDIGNRQVSTTSATPIPVSTNTAPVKSARDIEITEVTQLMAEGRYEDGTIKWLQSTHPAELFDKLFVRYTPDYLTSDVSPLVAFSVAITIANALQTCTARRLQWIHAALDAVDFQDPELADLSIHAPALLDSLVQKLENLYMVTSERQPGDPILRLIPPITHKARDMKAAAAANGRGQAR